MRYPDQLWWPELDLRKRDAVEYYDAIADVVLPHLRDRPFTIKQHYNGPRSPFRWLKDKPPDAPDWIPTTAQPAKSRGGALVHYVLVEDRRTLLWLVDYGAVDAGATDVKLDVKMNGHGQQIVAPYSIRPLPTAAVATPLRWAEVREGLAPEGFTPHVVRARVAEHGDLAAALLQGRQRLPV